MSERALDVLAFIARAMNPDAPLTVDLLRRRFTVREMRALRAHQRYLRLKLAELKAYEDVLRAIIQYKDVTEGGLPEVGRKPPLPTASEPHRGEHGRYTTYGRGCRCDRCREAMAEYQREYKRRKAMEATA